MDDIRLLAAQLVSTCDRAGLKLATAESCTGGMVAAAITDVPGSSVVFERGFVTYSNEAKLDMLAVDAEALAEHGAVSREIAVQMAIGAIVRSRADLAVSVTGIAGPGGGSPSKPVGLVHMALARRGEDEVLVVSEERLLLQDAFETDGRNGVRRATVRAALQALAGAAVPETP